MASDTSNDDASVEVAEMVTLDEFCTRLSKSDQRVELIGGFHYTEAAAGHIKDADSAFQNRFTVFVNKPV